jgi:hypothetical protein
MFVKKYSLSRKDSSEEVKVYIDEEFEDKFMRIISNDTRFCIYDMGLLLMYDEDD